MNTTLDVIVLTLGIWTFSLITVRFLFGLIARYLVVEPQPAEQSIYFVPNEEDL